MTSDRSMYMVLAICFRARSSFGEILKFTVLVRVSCQEIGLSFGLKILLFSMRPM
jgi:hypothetical protein